MWYYIENGQKCGPMDEQSMGELVTRGKLHAGTQVWCEGMAEWAAATTTPLSALFQFPTPPVPAPEAIASPAPVVEMSFSEMLFGFKGRLSNLPFFLYGLVLNIASFAVFLSGSLALPGGSQEANSLMLMLVVVGIPYIFLASAAVVKRLHDFNMSGGFAVLYFIASFIPLVNLIVAIALIAVPSTNGTNTYGNRTRIVWTRKSQP